ncbi:MAG: 2-hydroxyacyl-CoA dehydratase subunit D [Syntrophobacteraceae bacterium]
MPQLDTVTQRMLARPLELKEMKKKGVKVVATNLGDYIPFELIHAAGAVPICQVHGGDPEPVEAAHALEARFLCAFARAQMGYRVLKDQAYYELLDLLLIAPTCQHLGRFANTWEAHTDVEVFRVGVPHEYQTDQGMDYYVDSLGRLKEKLESFTGNKITPDKLRKSIELYNEMRGLLKKISLMRKSSPPLISSLDFAKLNHASYLLDPVVMVEELKSVCADLEKKRMRSENGKPRLMLLAPNIAHGDYKVYELVAETGGELVTEEVCEGIRAYWENVDLNGGDLLESLATTYLRKRCPGCFMRRVMNTRLEFAKELAKDFDVAGVIWYQLKFCETFDIEYNFYAQKLRAENLPVLKLDSEYDASDRGQMKTRIAAFIESIERR